MFEPPFPWQVLRLEPPELPGAGGGGSGGGGGGGGSTGSDYASALSDRSRPALYVATNSLFG